MKAVKYDLIRQRAYEIWEQRGRPEGQDKEHWTQAEQELVDAAPTIKAKRLTKSPAIVAAAKSEPTGLGKANAKPRPRRRGEVASRTAQ